MTMQNGTLLTMRKALSYALGNAIQMVYQSDERTFIQPTACGHAARPEFPVVQG
jgi:hypothetical protein